MKPDFETINRGTRRETLFFGVLRITPYLLIFLFALFLGRMVVRGVPVLTSNEIQLFTQPNEKIYSFYDENQLYHRLPEKKFIAYQKLHPDGLYLSLETIDSSGGIFGALVGTMRLILIAIFFATLIGLPAALFLSEYGGRSRFVSLIRMANAALAGVPPVVFGLFGMAFFCYFFPVISPTEPVSPTAFRWVLPNCPDWLDRGGVLYLSFQGWGLSLIAMGCTLACMALPIMISYFEKAFREVPSSFRDAALALGASRWQTIYQTILRNAVPGILTAITFGLIRVAGATAPLLFTGVVIAGSTPSKNETGTNLFWKSIDFLGRECEALSHHIYQLSIQSPQAEESRQILDGAVLILMLLVMLPVVFRFLLRRKADKNRSW